MPSVSVIVPIYNVEAYLETCIDSVLAQTFADFELILVDDGSPDNCGAICDEYAAKDSRIVVIHQKNGGLSAARNAGLDAAKGKYIYFLDGDDSIKPNLLETVLPYLEGGTDLVVFSHERVHSDGTAKTCCHELGTYALSEESRVRFFIDVLLSYSIGWEAWNRMFRREIIETFHLRFADNRRIFAEDLYFSICYCAHIGEIISIPQSLYRYSVREDSIMRQNKNVLNIGRMNELGKAVLQHFQVHADCAILLEAFPAMHYLIVDNLAAKSMHLANSFVEYRDFFRKDLSDWAFYEKMMRQLLRKPKYLLGKYPIGQLATRLSITKYILDGKYTAFRIRNKLLRIFGNALDTYLSQNKDKKY